MTVLKRRSRLVTFRISAEEYDELCRWCMASGARSISEFTRAAVLHNLQSLRSPAGALSGVLASVSESLSRLDASLAEIRKMIRRVLGNAKEANGENGA